MRKCLPFTLLRDLLLQAHVAHTDIRMLKHMTPGIAAILIMFLLTRCACLLFHRESAIE